MSSNILTAMQAKKRFEADGKTVSEWADAHGFPRDAVYALLSGRTVGRRGQAYRIAVALGIKRSFSPSKESAASEDC